MKQKHVLALVCAVVFNVLSASAISLASALPFGAVLGGGAVMSLFGGATSGALNMGLQVEIWHKSIVGNLFADDSFLSKAFNADDYVNGKNVHIPNAGRGSRTEKNREDVPATAKKRIDKDVEYKMDEYTTDPAYIPNAETVELSYNKRESVLKEDRAILHERIAHGILLSWSPKKEYVLRTSGNAVQSHLKGSTGYRKAFTVKDVNAAMVQFNNDDVPQEGRYALVDATMYSQLINSMTEKDAQAFHAAADVKNGVVGKLFTFNFMMRSKSLIYNSAIEALEWEPEKTFAPTDNSGVLFWHDSYVCRSIGDVKMFGSEDNPLYYGDIYSFLLRAGGTIMRSDNKGVIAVVQDTAEDGYAAPAAFSMAGLDVNTGQPTNEALDKAAAAMVQVAEQLAVQNTAPAAAPLEVTAKLSPEDLTRITDALAEIDASRKWFESQKDMLAQKEANLEAKEAELTAKEKALAQTEATKK